MSGKQNCLFGKYMRGFRDMNDNLSVIFDFA